MNEETYHEDPSRPDTIQTVVVTKTSVAAKTLMFFVGFLAGIVILVGTVAGVGFWAYKAFNLNTLENFGVSVPTDTIPTDSPLRTMTIEKLIAEITDIVGGGENTTLQKLIDKYKLKLPDSVVNMLPPAAMTIPVKNIFSGEGISEILNNTDGDYLVQAFGLNDPLFSKILKGKKISVFLSGDMSQIFEGVYVGDVLGYQSTSARVAWIDGAGNEISALMKKFADLQVAQLLGGEFDLMSMTQDLNLGDLIGYHRIQERNADGSPKTDENGKPIYVQNADGKDVWYETVDSADKEVSGIIAKLAGMTLNEVTDGDQLNDTVYSFKLGEVMQIDANSNPLILALQETPLKDLATKIDSLPVATAMGLTKNADGIYVDPQGKPIEGVLAVLAPITISGFGDAVKMEQTINGIKLGEAIRITDASPALLKALQDTGIGALSEKIETLRMGEAMGLYAKNVGTEEDPILTWYTDKECLTAADGLFAAFADMKLTDLNGETIKAKINGLKVADMFDVKTGIFSLLSDPDVTIENLPNALIRDVSTAKMGRLFACGIISDNVADSMEKISQAVYRTNATDSNPILDDSGAVAAPKDCWKFCDMNTFFLQVAKYIGMLSVVPSAA